MMPRQEWTAHVFNLGLDPGWAQNVLSRACDSALRLRHHCMGLPDAELAHKPSGKWSIKEHIGHLIDLEELHGHRLDEFALFKPVLVGADMSNAKTEKANHNGQPLESLISTFEIGRSKLVEKFLALDEKCHQHISMHPRLKAEMKPVDLFFFVAEHDDHHIATILEIKKLF